MTQTGISNRNEAEDRLLREVSADRLFGHAEALAQWERISGTDGERRAVEYLSGQLQAAGLEVSVHEFESLLGWPEEAALEVAGGEAVRAITHSFVPSTSEHGLEAEVVYVESDDTIGEGVAGRVALVEGMATPLKVLRGHRAGAAGLIFIQEDRLHEMCVSPVWGTPTTRTAELLPALPAVSVLREDGERLKSRARDGGLRVRMRTRTFWGWRRTAIVAGHLRGAVDPDQFVLFSGHHCSWYRGAMDNGTANATMLEVARLLAERRAELHRSVRVVFWPGHTQGRYSGSTWYFDTFWEDLHDNCVLHVNVDSTGARGAAIYHALGMPETSEFAVAAIRDAIGEEAEPERQSRAGDQSFWSCGVPSVFMDLSHVPAEMAARSGGLFAAAGQDRRSRGGLPWWWHTAEDTIDKIDPAVLQRDTRVYALATWRAATAPVLPFRYAPAARDIRQAIESYQAATRGKFDLGPALERAAAAEGVAGEVDRRLDEIGAGERLPAELVARVNRALEEMDRELVGVNFTASGPFDQDLAVPIPPVPLLEPARRLGTLDPASPEARFLATELTRHRNQVAHRLRLAARAGERAAALLAEAAG
jgi:Iap family predicted aminopeptidase